MKTTETEKEGAVEPMVISDELPAFAFHPGYHARNLDLAKCVGLNAGLCAIKEHMRARKDCPLWLIEQIDDMIHRSNCLIRPLTEHRDEIKREAIKR